MTGCLYLILCSLVDSDDVILSYDTILRIFIQVSDMQTIRVSPLSYIYAIRMNTKISYTFFLRKKEKKKIPRKSEI